MKEGRLRVAVVFGGRSAEHEVSLQSAKNVVEALDPEKYEIVLIGIDREGRWFLNENSLSLINADDPRLIALGSGEKRVALTPDGDEGALVSREVEKGLTRPLSGLGRLDLLFPVLHGPYGEDGSIQGLAKLANLPCVGADILGSALGMDKDVMKRLLRDAGIAIAPFRCYRDAALACAEWDSIVAELGADLFVKPANLGSSVGISHVESREDFEKAVKRAFEYDTKLIVESRIFGRELEVAVLIPAPLSREVSDALRAEAIKAYKALCVHGMARVDFFLEASGRIVVNEINTIPGFTRISMYPKLWAESGLSYGALLDRLIGLAIEDYSKRSALRSSPGES